MSEGKSGAPRCLLPLVLCGYAVAIWALSAWLPRNAGESWLRELFHVAAILTVLVLGTRRVLSVPGAIVCLVVGVALLRLRVLDSPGIRGTIGFSISDAGLMVACIGAGQIVSRMIKAPNVLVPVGVAAALVDTVGVYVGFVAKAVRYNQEAVVAVSSSLPTASAANVPLASLGPGDILFMALFLTCLAKFRLDVKAVAAWLFIAVAGVFALLMLTEVGDKMVIPGLPVIVAASILPSARSFSFSKEEKRSLLIAAAIMIPMLAIVTLLGRLAAAWLGWR